MLLAVDIGNSSIKFGVFDANTLLVRFSIPTRRDATTADLQKSISGNLDLPITAVIICSVVPEAERAVRDFMQQRYKVAPIFVNNGFDLGLKIRYEPENSLGTDRLVAAYAAVKKFGRPVIVCDFGTATTIDAVNAKSEFLGGVIAPGMNAMAEALHFKAAKLPRVNIVKPEAVIGTSTLGSILSGVFYGYIGLVEGLVRRMTEEVGKSTKIVATGGLSKLIAENTEILEIVDENLVLEGLLYIHNARTHPAVKTPKSKTQASDQ
jgi:type III pantothenate kinase